MNPSFGCAQGIDESDLPGCMSANEPRCHWSSPQQYATPVLRNNYERQDAFRGSRCQRFQAIFVMQSRQDRRRDDSVTIRDLMPVRSRQPVDGHVGNARTAAGVWSTLVVVSHPLQQDGPKVAFMQHEQPVQTLTTNRADQPLAKRIRLRTAHGRFRTVRPIA